MLRRAILAGALVASLPAIAQVLPETSRSEAQSRAINESLAAEGRNRAAVQQNQFEINSLRNQQAPSAPAPVVVAPPIAGPAPIGR